MKELQKFIEVLEEKAKSNPFCNDETEVNIWYVIANLRKIMLQMGVSLKSKVLEVEEETELKVKYDRLQIKYLEAQEEIVKLQHQLYEKDKR